MSTVWSGVHTALGKPVAIKFMRRLERGVDETLLFLNEARVLARIDHPGIVRVFDAGLCPADVAMHLDHVDAMSPFFVMEQAGRGTLSTEDVTDWQTAKSLLISLLDGLAHAHARGVIHRDLKPDNVLVDDDGSVRLTDFGIAYWRDVAGAGATDIVRGTPAYMAPESVAGASGRQGPWTDLYSLGCLACWMTTGDPPFSGQTSEVLDAHLHDEPPSLKTRFETPDGFAAICRKLLRKEPQARYVRAADAARALARLPDVEADVEQAHSPPPVPVQAIPTMPLATVVETLGNRELDTDPGDAEGVAVPKPPADWRYPERSAGLAGMLSGPGLLDFREAPFQGRESDRDTLWAHLLEAWSGDDIVIRIGGPDGIGRTRLMEWFARRAHEVGAAHVLSFEDDADASMLRILRRWCDEVGGAAGVDAFFERVDGESAVWPRPHLKRLAQTGEIADSVLESVFCQWSARLSAERVVLVAATCDVTTLVGELRRGPRGRRLVVFVGEVGEAHDHALELGPLDASELERIIAEQFGFSDAASHRLARQAEGNPGAAVRWARLAIRENLVRRTPAGLELAGSKMRALVQESRHWDVRLEHAIDDDVSAEQALRLAASVGEYVLQSEFEAICAAIDARANELLARFFDAGVLVVHDDEIRFAHPDARQAMLGRDRLSTHDFSILADVFANLASSDRRIRIGALAALKAGEASPQMCLERARELRRRGAVADSLRLLSGIREHNQSKDWDMALAQEQLECHIAQHAYDAARAVLASTMQRTPTLDALELFLAHRSGDDVQDALLRVDTSDLSETATRMVAYAWTDIGAFDRARAALETLDPELDPAGKYYALARLALLQDEWTDAKRFGQQAARAFADSSQLEGRLVALDIVASARLQLGELDAAIGDYRGLEEQAEQLGAPTWPYKCNLAVALLRLEPPPLEIEAHLESVIADVIEAGRRDVEHYARAAQALYALKRGKVALARKRLESLRDMGAGQWMVDDVLVLLREMDASVCDTSLAAIVDEVLAAAEEALA